jgi:hypothetical protein
MKTYTPAMLAKLTAFRDIAEDCKKEKRGQNYIIWEREICWMLGIPQPDFRMFNGGWNRGTGRIHIYVTYYTRSNSKRRAVRCDSDEHTQECVAILRATPEILDIRINKCGRFKKKIKIIPFEKFKEEKKK